MASSKQRLTKFERETRRIELVKMRSRKRPWAEIAAALGYLPPVQGAVLQEVIDVAVIANALRALGGTTERGDVV